MRLAIPQAGGPEKGHAIVAELAQALPAVSQPAAADSYRGHIDLYGFNEAASGAVFCGWVSHRLAEEIGPGEFILRFGATEVSGTGVVTFYHREQLGDLGVGIVLFVWLKERPVEPLASVTLATGNGFFAITPSRDARDVGSAELSRSLDPVLGDAPVGFPDSLLSALLPQRNRSGGYLETIGYEPSLGCWLGIGWVPSTPAEEPPFEVAARINGSDAKASATIAFYPRADLRMGGTGIVLQLRLPAGDSGEPGSIEFDLHGRSMRLRPIPGAKRLECRRLIGAVLPVLRTASDGPGKTSLLRLLSGRVYDGSDSLDLLTDNVMISPDVAVFCPPNGLVLMGWLLARPGTIRRIRLRSAHLTATLDLDSCVRFPRADVIEAVGREHGFQEAMCGFVAYFPEGYSPLGPSYLEIETVRGEIGFRNLPAPKLRGLPAIQRILGDCDIQYADVAPAFARVLGPCIGRLNAERLAERPEVACLEFGDLPRQPEYTVIVPLYRRLEYMELQFALFARDPAMASMCELIYVLDDPPKRRELENLAAAIHARFKIPFKVLLLSRNMGFAPANNIALAQAHGRYVCFLNSDAFPDSPNWLARLCARLEVRPELGVVGPLLLHEDGSVQHQGMTWQALPQFGNWYFNDHIRLGMKPPGEGGVQESPAITGACMVMRTDLAKEIGGFDESYVVGDFEDSDLCLRLRERGFGSAVDLDIRVCHLGRKSQPSAENRWRMNLILYNAWLHHRRWGETIGELLKRVARKSKLIAASAAVELVDLMTAGSPDNLRTLSRATAALAQTAAQLPIAS
jgi:GT2 family glycosyltransferase